MSRQENAWGLVKTILSILVILSAIAGSAYVTIYRVNAFDARVDKLEVKIEAVSALRQLDHDTLIAITNQLGTVARQVSGIYHQLKVQP